MSYDASQKLLVARALARHGRNVAKAQAHLRNEYETFRRISLNTLRKMLHEKKFDAMVEAEYELWLDAERRGVASATEEQARRKAEGTIIQKVGRLEAIFDLAVEQVQKQLQTLTDEKLSMDQKLKLLEMMGRIIDRRKDRLLPVIAETSEGAYLVEATYEAMYAKLGSARTKELMAAIGPLYESKRKAGEAKRVTAQVTEEAT